MKKLLISAFLVLTFGVYALHQRSENNKTQLTAPSSLTSTQSNPSTTPISSGNSNLPSDTPNPTPTPTATPTPSPVPAPTPTPAPAPKGQYTDGQYTGTVEDALYGNVQVQATVQNGKLTNVQFLQYPNDRQNSREINSQAMPWLTQEAIQAQSANVDGVSGASQTSAAFIRSLSSALSQAKA